MMMKSVAILASMIVGTAGCASEQSETDSNESVLSQSSDVNQEPVRQTVRVSGCMQQSGGDFVLTMAPEDVAVEKPGEPQSAQLEAASEAYRLDGDEDRFEAVLGSRVEVVGRVEERSDLPALERPGGRNESRTNPLDLDVSNLAELSVESIETTGQPCGEGDSRGGPGA